MVPEQPRAHVYSARIPACVQLRILPDYRQIVDTWLDSVCLLGRSLARQYCMVQFTWKGYNYSLYESCLRSSARTVSVVASISASAVIRQLLIHVSRYRDDYTAVNSCRHDAACFEACHPCGGVRVNAESSSRLQFPHQITSV